MSKPSSERLPAQRAQHPAALAQAAGKARSPGPARRAVELLSGVAAAVELTPMVAVRSFDRDGIVCFWNHKCAELYGIKPEDALGQPLARLIPHVREADLRAAIEQIWRSGRPCPPCDWQVSGAGGAPLWIYTTMFPIFNAGKMKQIFCMDVDITARKLEQESLVAAGANIGRLYDKSADAILLLRDMRIADANPAAVALFHCPDKQRMLGRSLNDFSPLQQPSGDASAQFNARMAAQADASGNCRYDFRYLTCQGHQFWAEVLLTSIAADQQSLTYALIRDISARKYAERSLYLAAQVFENARDAIAVTDQARRVIAINHAYTEITGFGAADMIGTPFAVQHGEGADAALPQAVWSELGQTGHWQGEMAAQRKSGERYPAWLSLTAIRDSHGAACNYMAILSDITERKKLEAHTRHLAEHDFLTDLPNRVLLLDRLSRALVAARRKNSMLAVLFLDLDHFKNINDTLGHHAGDMLLKEVARRLCKCVREVDTVSRRGGDEFVVILSDIGGIDQAAHVAASILQAVGGVYQGNEYTLDVSASIGISVFPGDGDDVDTLVKNADIAMYHAKENGRNGFQFFSAEMNARIVERVTFENGLQRALEQNQLVLEYQPEIDVKSGAMVGAEALLRWRHPELGLLAPGRFIAVAEECGMMIPIGKWVLHQACRQARRWHDGGHSLVVAVNLSAAQFMQKNLPQSVREALQASALPAHLLELEITEAIIMQGGARAGAILAALRELGLNLTIDDFGTGYSRVGDLRGYPIGKLKIDRSFMAGITGDPNDAAVIATIIAMARGLGLKVSAEGVETAAQMAFLRAQDCDAYQGFYASPAVPENELGALLKPVADGVACAIEADAG